MQLIGAAYRANVTLPDGKHEYRFRVQDAANHAYWLADPKNPVYVTNRNGTVHSYLLLQNGIPIPPQQIPNIEYFEYTAPNAKHVNLAGDFNNWTMGTIDLIKDVNGVWRCWGKFKRPLNYAFVVDDLWVPDPNRAYPSRPSNFGTYHSFRPAIVNSDQADWLAPVLTISSALTTATEREAQKEGRAGDYNGALLRLKAVESANTSNSRTRLKTLNDQADLHMKYGFPGRAAEVWEKVAKADPTSTAGIHAAFELGKHKLYTQHDPAAARAEFAKLLDVGGNSTHMASVLFNISMCYWEEHNYSQQISTLRQAIAIAPPCDKTKNKDWCHECSEMHLYLGLALVRTGDTVNARNEFLAVIDLAPFPNTANAQHARTWISNIDGSTTSTDVGTTSSVVGGQ